MFDRRLFSSRRPGEGWGGGGLTDGAGRGGAAGRWWGGDSIRVRTVLLDGNRLGPGTGRALGSVLVGGSARESGRPPPIERLSLAGNGDFGDRGLEVLAPALGMPACSVAWLDVSSCGIHARGGAGGLPRGAPRVPGVLALAAAISARPFALLIAKNKLGAEGKAALAVALPDSKYGRRVAEAQAKLAAKEGA
eukprot:SAG25_NODE_580_length_6767_cov_20.692412_6_plen_193_part_00